MHFEVAIGEYLPFLKLTVESGTVYLSGPLAEVFHTLSISLNFTYTLHKVKGNSWGVHTEKGWTGMLGMIDRNEVDMALGPFTITYDRWSSFRLSNPVYVDHVTILAPASEWKMTLFSAVSVFSASVWILIFSSTLLLSALMTIIEKYRESSISLSQRFLRNLWSNLCVLLQKGRKEKRSTYIKSFITILWILSAFVLSSVFGGIMLTKLFVRKIQIIDSIEDLTSSPNIQPILENDSSVFGIFKKSEVDVYKTIFQRIINNPAAGLSNYEEMPTIGMDHVFSGTAAMITDGMGLKGFMGRRYKEGLPCQYWLAKETVLTMWKVLAFSQNFPKNWANKINQRLTSILESGWLQTRMEEEYRHYVHCISQGNTELTSLKFEHVKGIFLIWGIGIATASLFFICEFFQMYPEWMFSAQRNMSANKLKKFDEKR